MLNSRGYRDKNVTNFYLPNNSTYSNVYEMYNYSNVRVVNASSLKCNNISVSYFLSGKSSEVDGM